MAGWGWQEAAPWEPMVRDGDGSGTFVSLVKAGLLVPLQLPPSPSPSSSNSTVTSQAEHRVALPSQQEVLWVLPRVRSEPEVASLKLSAVSRALSVVR